MSARVQQALGAALVAALDPGLSAAQVRAELETVRGVARVRQRSEGNDAVCAVWRAMADVLAERLANLEGGAK